LNGHGNHIKKRVEDFIKSREEARVVGGGYGRETGNRGRETFLSHLEKERQGAIENRRAIEMKANLEGDIL